VTTTGAITFALIASWIVSAIVLLVVDRLNIGLKVRSFLYALVAAAAIVIVAAVVGWVLGALGVTLATAGILGFVIGIFVNALILWLAAKFTPGFEIANYPAALVVAIVIAAIWWLVTWIGGMFL
jgi:putative membrane protein